MAANLYEVEIGYSRLDGSGESDRVLVRIAALSGEQAATEAKALIAQNADRPYAWMETVRLVSRIDLFVPGVQ